MCYRVMGIKKGKCCHDHWVLYTSNESLNTTSKSNDVLIQWLTEHNKKKILKTKKKQNKLYIVLAQKQMHRSMK